MSWYLKKRIPSIEAGFNKPGEVQDNEFKYLLSQAQKTIFGKEYNLKDVSTFEQFKQRVPLHQYDDIKPYINRVMKGEQRVLWPGEINWFAKSSGTTSDKSKFIPVSFETLENCQFRGSRDIIGFFYHNNPNAKLFQGKGVIIGGSHQVNELSANSFYGDLSAVMMNNLPFIANFLTTPSMDIALMDNWEEKLEKMAEAIYNEDVTNISGVPTWTLLLLRRLMEMGNTNSILDVWPNIELYVHGGVNFSPYRSQFQDIINTPSMNYRETYNASEGFFGLQDQKDENMLLMLDYGIFYEFIPIEYADRDNPKTYSLTEVELNKCYAVVLNSNAGLWRYIVGDTITFTSKNPYRFVINGRTKHFINAFGEELMIDNAEKAMAETQKQCNCQVSDFTAAPVYIEKDKKGGHEWFIEFTKEPADLNSFAQVLDAELMKQNSDYEAKRQSDLAIVQPVIKKCPEGTFHKWLKGKDKLGGQHKVPRLSNDRKIITELNEIINS